METAKAEVMSAAVVLPLLRQPPDYDTALAMYQPPCVSSNDVIRPLADGQATTTCIQLSIALPCSSLSLTEDSMLPCYDDYVVIDLLLQRNTCVL